MISVFDSPKKLLLYTAEQVKWLERQYCNQLTAAKNTHSSPSYFLMEAAGEVLWNAFQQQFAHCCNVLIVVGNGNNGGDGYELANLLLQKQSLQITVAFVSEHQDLNKWIAQSQGDAAEALKKIAHKDILIKPFSISDLKDKDLIVDGLLGTGIKEPSRQHYVEVIYAINQSATKVLSIDIPSGLDANTGAVIGAAIRATSTVSFVGLKKGLVTGAGLDYCGKLYFDDLGVILSEQLIDRDIINQPPMLLPYNDIDFLSKIIPRSKNSHKGSFGTVVVIAGNQGMGGAGILCAEAALRVGAGKVILLTHSSHANSVLSYLPEIMTVAMNETNLDELSLYLERATTLVIGPGLGNDNWAKTLLESTLQYAESHSIPCLVDADGLRQAKKQGYSLRHCMITPHPGEAADLLDTTTTNVQKNRFKIAAMLEQKISDHVLLKGAGSICSSKYFLKKISHFVCPHGNPGMSTAGMGDVLAGMIGGLSAQGLSESEALLAGMLLHSLCADEATKKGEVGMIASDLFKPLRKLLNQSMCDNEF